MGKNAPLDGRELSRKKGVLVFGIPQAWTTFG